MIRKKNRQSSQTAESEPSRLSPYPPPGAWASPSAKEPDWEVGIFGDLTDKQAELFQQLLEVPRNSRGTIYFDSGGGSIYCGLALATLIKLRIACGRSCRRRMFFCDDLAVRGMRATTCHAPLDAAVSSDSLAKRRGSAARRSGRVDSAFQIARGRHGWTAGPHAGG